MGLVSDVMEGSVDLGEDANTTQDLTSNQKSQDPGKSQNAKILALEQELKQRDEQIEQYKKDLSLVVVMDDELKQKDDLIKQKDQDLKAVIMMDDDIKRLENENQELKQSLKLSQDAISQKTIEDDKRLQGAQEKD